MSDLVDWRLAERVATAVAGQPEPGAFEVPQSLAPGGLERTCEEAEALVRAYAELDPPGRVPTPESVDRGGWLRAVLGTLRELASEMEGSRGIEVSLPGRLGGITGALVGAAGATEVGLAAGYAARRVLGQYDVALVGAQRPPRLLFVQPNLLATAQELRVEAEPFVRWVALHETTHAVQFAAAPWLRDHLGGLIRSLLEGALSGAAVSELLRRLVRDPRGALSSFMRGDIARAIAGPEQAPTLDAIQATMTVIEGHAEHVMDRAAGHFVPSAAELRDALEARRRSRGPLETMLVRLLGLDLKLRQYEVGKRFCDEVAAQAGIGTLNAVWHDAGQLPTLDELRAPGDWVHRVGSVAAA